jgi:Asp-tRNA(Asn)/Glu-tRNA(Gln) amidotransferase C subunit
MYTRPSKIFSGDFLYLFNEVGKVIRVVGMTGNYIDIDRLASAAKIWLTDAGTDEVRRDMAPFIEMAESIAGVDLPDCAAPSNLALDVYALRGDVPAREIETGIFYEQSPSAGGGFTIPMLLE